MAGWRKFALLALLLADPASAQSPDFGIRSLRPVALPGLTVRSLPTLPRAGASGLSGAVSFASRLGRVTSTFRSAAHNCAVGGVANSFHLSGRAIDVVRRPGVHHRDIAAALIAAGYRLRESLDEGDHSHFAFDFGGLTRHALPRAAPVVALAGLSWKIVYAPNVRHR
jgi:Peptidase M15